MIILTTLYDVAITNPPYMGTKGLNNNLTKRLKKLFPNSKSDLFAVFIERCNSFTKENGFISHVTMHSWMFLSSYESLRKELLNTLSFYSVLHLGMEAFEGIIGKVVQTVAVSLRKSSILDMKFKGIRLVDYYDSKRWEKEAQFFNRENHFLFPGTNYFKDLPGMPIAYWTSKKIFDLFRLSKSLGEIVDIKSGLQSSDNNRFLKLWFETDFSKIGFNFDSRTKAKVSNLKWFPYNKGGSYRKWYGNKEYVVNWQNDGQEIREYSEYINTIKASTMGVAPNAEYYFRPHISWSLISSMKISTRYFDKGTIFDISAPSIFVNSEHEILLYLGLLNSKVSNHLTNIINPTLNFSSGVMKKLPFIYIENPKILELSRECISISRSDWNSFESSWDFEGHPLINNREDSNLLSSAFDRWLVNTDTQFNRLKNNEIELNSIFIDLYGLQDELSPEVPDEEITIHRGERVRDTKSFLSYFIGCVIGRYTLDIKGLAYAGGEWDDWKYKTFIPNKIGLIQLTDEHYFEDDIIARLREFLSVTFGKETVEENLIWLAESLELKRNESAEERLRRYFLDDFFKDHCQVYQKRPIYWLVDSGKQKGLRTLIYMHRYQPDTMATIRFEHLQEIQAKYNNEISAIDLRIVNPNLTATEKRDLEKRKTAFQKRLDELLEFDKKLAEYANAQIEIDLDDGVKVNYAKFDKVLAKIK